MLAYDKASTPLPLAPHRNLARPQLSLLCFTLQILARRTWVSRTQLSSLLSTVSSERLRRGDEPRSSLVVSVLILTGPAALPF
jgi:hypothetical protein